jgi:hypothetical protein
MDDYLAMIGAAPTSREAQEALANSLRRRRSFGELGQITGDKVLAPMGAGMVGQADDYAKQIQKTRLADVDNAQTKTYQDAQMQQMQKNHVLQQAMLAETRRGNNLDFSARMAAIKQRNMESILESMSKGQDFKKFTDGTRNKMLTQADTASSMKTLADTFTDEYTQILGAGPQSRLPNTAALMGVGSKGSKDAAQWWGEWKKFYTLGTRNALFGATLTTNEQRAWEEVDINPSMSPEQIRNRINKLFAETSRSAERRGKSMSVEGFDPEVISEMYGDVFPDLKFGPSGQQGRGGSRTRKITSAEDMQSLTTEDIQNMLDELSQGQP